MTIYVVKTKPPRYITGYGRPPQSPKKTRRDNEAVVWSVDMFVDKYLKDDMVLVRCTFGYFAGLTDGQLEECVSALAARYYREGGRDDKANYYRALNTIRDKIEQNESCINCNYTVMFERVIDRAIQKGRLPYKTFRDIYGSIYSDHQIRLPNDVYMSKRDFINHLIRCKEVKTLPRKGDREPDKEFTWMELERLYELDDE